jgi:UDP-N-acetylmuramoyl-L-alanyl-D-glutamate--2,6-diaminopimelate ligase
MPQRPTTRLDEVLPAGSGGVRMLRPGGGGSGWETQIRSLAYDSREVRAGALFFCVRGFASDGHDHAREAADRGAAALVVERPVAVGLPEVEVESVRAAMAPAAVRFFGDPSASLRVIGVTGTNGKTTTAFLIRALLERVGVRCGLLGTVKSVIGGREQPVLRTTPEAIDLQAALRAMVDAGDEACAIEVSSHALALGRAARVRFAGAVFTNLTQDHLDFHADMEEYFQAKRLLFLPGDAERVPAVCAINAGDPYGARLARELPACLTYAVESDPRARGGGEAAGAGSGEAALYRATDVRLRGTTTSFRLSSPGGSHEVELPMPGRFNVANALGALTVLHGLGFELDGLVGALAEPVAVPGRLEAVQAGQPFAVFVDYAHTPDSLERVLEAVRELAEGRGGRVVCVMGAGGDRDRAKRAPMGAAAARGADVVIVTSDNPRSEDPEAIIAEVLRGARAEPAGSAAVEALVDRREAIARALALAQEADVVLIAGKGHERGQELAGGRVVAFDDVAVAREALLAGAAA